MGVDWICVFHESRIVLDPRTVGLNQRLTGIAFWSGAIAYGALQGWGKPELLSDEGDQDDYHRCLGGDEDVGGAAAYTDRTEEAMLAAVEDGLLHDCHVDGCKRWAVGLSLLPTTSEVMELPPMKDGRVGGLRFTSPAQWVPACADHAGVFMGTVAEDADEDVSAAIELLQRLRRS